MRKQINPEPYQISALQYQLDNTCGGLFLDPGLGKTVITLTYLKHLLDSKKISRALVIAPLRPCRTAWISDAEKWEHLEDLPEITFLHGKGKLKSRIKNTGIHLINPEGLPWLLSQVESREVLPWQALVVDESSNYSEPTAKTRFKLLKPLVKLFTYRWILNGTPTPRGYMSMFAQAFLVDNGESFGSSFYKFRDRYYRTTDYMGYNWEIKGEAEKTLIENKVKKIALHIDNSVLGLPPVETVNVPVELEPKHLLAYKTLEKELATVLESGDEIVSQTAATAWGRCRQYAQGFVFPNTDPLTGERESEGSIPVHSAKVSALRDLCQEIGPKQVFIAYHYRPEIEMIAKALRPAKVVNLTDVPDKDLKKTIQQWQDGKIRYLLGQPQSVSHGIDGLQGDCRHIVWFDPTSASDRYRQFCDRIRRRGCKHTTVMSYRLVVSGTVDVTSALSCDRREEDQQSFLEYLKKDLKKRVYSQE